MHFLKKNFFLKEIRRWWSSRLVFLTGCHGNGVSTWRWFHEVLRRTGRTQVHETETHERGFEPERRF